MVELAKEIKSQLQELGLGRVILENTGNIGKSYRRHDEINLLCVTVDFESLENSDITVRDRDTMKQERIEIKDLNAYFLKYF